MTDNTGGGPMLDRHLYDEALCAVPDCTIPADGELCEAHRGGR